jgi:hypothetical protein
MPIDKSRVGKVAMDLMDNLEGYLPEGEIEALVICAAVRRDPDAKLQVVWVGEPAGDKSLMQRTAYTVARELRDDP